VFYTGSMTMTELRETALQFPPEDRLKQAEELWASIDEDTIPLHEWQIRLLDERIEVDEKTPGEGSSWPEVKQRILKKL
jgi:putative addiction module component (TIGR02574 family)